MCAKLSTSEPATIHPFDTEMVELALCLPGWQAQCLEDAAHQRGLTAGQYLRRLIHDALDSVLPPSVHMG